MKLNAKFSKAIYGARFLQSLADYSLFTKHTNKSFMVVLIDMDDMVIARDDEDEIFTLKHFLSTQLKSKTLED